MSDTPAGGSVLVLGLGTSGYAAARYLATLKDGVERHVVAVDGADTPQLRSRAQELSRLGVDAMLGVEHVGGSYSLAVVSPGIKPSSELWRSAKDASFELIGELELAYRVSRVPWVAVTGTNGKTTVTSLIAHLIESSGMPADVAGNIGPAAIDVASQASPPTIVVAEVSSFQLATTVEFQPRVSVLLNITPDHLDWHGGMESYVRDKAAVFANQDANDTAVIDVDGAGSAPFAEVVRAQGVRVVPVSARSLPEGGAGTVGTLLALATPSGTVELLDRSELLIKGDHNVGNALAAAAAAHACGVAPEDIAAGLRTFEPIEHRLEPVAVIDGVEYINDSKATNPDAALKALTAFPDRGLVVLLGGRNKGNSFDELADAIARADARAVVFGEAGPLIDEALHAAGVESARAGSMREAVELGRTASLSGDVVLLAPACASFDEFADYQERGREFRRIVTSMQREAM